MNSKKSSPRARVDNRNKDLMQAKAKARTKAIAKSRPLPNVKDKKGIKKNNEYIIAKRNKTMSATKF